MFPNSDTSEIKSTETHDCTVARRSRVKRLSVALLATITLVVGITAAGQLSIAEAAGTVVAVDDAGADDEPGQKDLSWLSIDYGAPGATALTVKWGWDDTATSGANTRDAGSLFDTDGDGFANYSLYVTVASDGSHTTQLYSCAADSRTDRCAGPALVSTFASTATVAVTADSDPFGVPGSADYDAAHVTGNTCRATTGCYTQDTVATADVRLSDFGNPADAFLLNVCSYPSGEPNSDPSDCVFAPNNGFLTIVKVANPDDGTSFPFNSSEQSESNDSSWTITGSGSQSLISYGATTTLDLNEAVPAGWKLDSASCAIQTATPTATGTSTATGIDNLEIRSGLETICTFNDTKTNPLLEVVKSSTTSSISAAGQVVPYRFAVSNKGNVALTGITVTDPKCDGAPAYVSGDSDADSKLDLSETWIYSCSHTVSQAELDAGGSLSNTVTADSNESGPDTDTLLIPVSQSPLLEVVKSSTTSSISAAGQVVPYRFAVSNKGNVALTGITVTDPKCDGAPAYVSGDSDADSKLDLSETWIYSCSHTVSQAELDAGGSLSNTVTADSNESGPDTDTLLIPVSQSPLLEVVKSSTTSSISAAGQVVPYRFAVSNKGNVALTGITVTDPKCDGAPAYVSGDSDADSKLDLSETWIYSCSHTVSQAELDAGGSLSNTVTADSNESGPDTDTLLIPVSQSPLLEVVKSSTTSSTYSTVAQSISYSYLVSNSGNVRLAGPVTVADDKTTVSCPALSDGFLDPGESITCSASYAITQADLNNGSVTNTAKASAGGIDSNEDKATVDAVQQKTLSLDKSALPATYDSVGDVIGYSYLVANTGNVRLAGPVTVADDKATVACPNVNTVGNLDSFLDPAEQITCTASYSITQADLNAGSVTNTAKASAAGIDSNEDKATVDAVQRPSLVLDKTASPISADAVGDVITYTYLVTNTGNVRLAGPVTVADDKATVSCPALSTIGNNDGFLDPGESITCSASYAITQADLNNGSVTNTAKASSGGIDSNEDKATVTVTPPPPPPPPTPAPPTAIVVAAPSIDLSIIKTDRPDPVFVGARLTYTLTVRNAGPDTATNVRVADALPAATTFVSVASSQGTCTGGRVVRCSLGTMLSGSRAAITIVVRPTAPGVLLNTATVVGEQSEANTANNRATAPTLVRGPIAPPVASCPNMIVQPRSLSVGRRGLVRVVVVDKNRGVSGVRILVKGPGLNKAAFTNSSGRVAISVRPPRTGIVEIRMTNQPSRCSTTRIGVVGVILPPPVTG